MSRNVGFDLLLLMVSEERRPPHPTPPPPIGNTPPEKPERSRGDASQRIKAAADVLAAGFRFLMFLRPRLEQQEEKHVSSPPCPPPASGCNRVTLLHHLRRVYALSLNLAH